MNQYMQEAISEAYAGIENGDGGPFGCVIVKDNIVVGRGHNEVLKQNDCICHGEILAIRDACKNLNTFDLTGCSLYTTSEPCPMCAGAIQWAGIKDVYYGCDVRDAVTVGFHDKFFYDETQYFQELDRSECQKLFSDYKKLNLKRYNPEVNNG